MKRKREREVYNEREVEGGRKRHKGREGGGMERKCVCVYVFVPLGWTTV